MVAVTGKGVSVFLQTKGVPMSEWEEMWAVRTFNFTLLSVAL